MIRLPRVSLITSSRACTVLLAVALVFFLPTAGQAQEEDFSIVLLPDSQYYFNNEWPGSNQTLGIYEDQTCWIIENSVEKNIKFVIHLGDIIDDKCEPEWPSCDKKTCDDTGVLRDRWGWAHDAHRVLWDPTGADPDTPEPACGFFPEGTESVRFSVLPGNHDGPRDFTLFNELDYFGPDSFDCFMHGQTCVDAYAYGESIERSSPFNPPNPPLDAGRNEANWQTFEVGNQKFLVLSLPARNRGGSHHYDVPSKDDICWANEIVTQHSDRHVIVATHGYTAETSFDDWEGPPDGGCPRAVSGWISGAATVYEELVARHSNIFMVVSGHIGDSEHRVRLRNVDGDPAGTIDQTVHEILTDYQFEDPQVPSSGSWCYRNNECDMEGYPWSWCDTAGHCHGGNGWLRLLDFKTSENHVYASIDTTIDPTDTSWYGGMFGDPATDGPPRLNHCGYCNGNDCAPYHWKADHPNHQFDFPYDFSTVPTAHDTTSHTFRDRWVNQPAAENQQRSAVAMDQAGNFVVAWQDSRGTVPQTYIRGFDRFGCERFPETRITPSSVHTQRYPVLAMDSEGNFVVAWDEIYSGDDYDVHLLAVSKDYGEDLDGDGSPDSFGNYASDVLTPHISGSNSDQVRPDVDMTSNGKVVVVWQDARVGPTTRDNIHGMAYILDTSSGVTLTPQWTSDELLHPDTSDNSHDIRPAVAIAENGNFVVAYQDRYDSGNSRYDIDAYGWRFDVQPEASEDNSWEFKIIHVNNLVNGSDHWTPEIDMDADGRFVIVWRDDDDDNDYYDVYMRGFNANGDDWFAETAVKHADDQQDFPDVAMAPSSGGDARFVVTWHDDAPSTDGYYKILASAYTADTQGNLVTNVDEFMVHWDFDGKHEEPRAAMAPDGDFVVTWTDDRDNNGDLAVMARGLEWNDLRDSDDDRGANDQSTDLLDGWDNCPTVANNGVCSVTRTESCTTDAECDPANCTGCIVGEVCDLQSDFDGDGLGDACDPCPYSAINRDCDVDGDDQTTAAESHRDKKDADELLSTDHVELLVGAEDLLLSAESQEETRQVCLVISEHPVGREVDIHEGRAVTVVESTVESDFQAVDVTLTWDDADLPPGYAESLLAASKNGRAIGSGGFCMAPDCVVETNRWTFSNAGHGEYLLGVLAGAGSVANLTLDKEGTDLRLEWVDSCWSPDNVRVCVGGSNEGAACQEDTDCTDGGSCGDNDGDYAIYEGEIGNYYSHEQLDCIDDTGDALSEVITPSPSISSSYYLVVPKSSVALYEGSYGSSSAGERPPATAACDGRAQEIIDCP